MLLILFDKMNVSSIDILPIHDKKQCNSTDKVLLKAV